MSQSEIQFLKKIGEKVNEKIRDRGYRSVELFAHETGISQSVLSRFISGSRSVNLSTIIKIARALEVSLDELCADAFSNIKQGKAIKNSVSRAVGKGRKRKLVLDFDEFDRLEIRNKKSSSDSIHIEFKRGVKGS